MPFSELEPPSTLPRGQYSWRPAACFCGVVMTAQSLGPMRSAGQPWGLWMLGSESTPPASMMCTVWPASSSRLATALPAEPAPMTM